MTTHLLEGAVRSGGTSTVVPLGSAQVSVFVATSGTPTLLGTVTANSSGRFSLQLGAVITDTVFYATATLPGGRKLATIIGPRIVSSIIINELTTVAAAFSMAQFTANGTIAGNAFGLRIAAGMNDNLVSPLTGEPSPVMLRSPNADETNSLRSTRTLANLLIPSIRQVPGAFEALQSVATPPDGEAPADTFQALVNIARHPARHVGGIYRMARQLESYLPSLAVPPDAWTLAVKVNDSGNDAFLFGGPANIAWDRNGYAWVANNVKQGGPNSARWIMVLQPDGRPSDGRNGTPLSPVFGGGIKGVGFGVTVAPNGHAWVGNFGWGDPDTQYPKVGSASEFHPDGTPVTEVPHVGGTWRVQATVADTDGTIWLASFGNNALVVFPEGSSRAAFEWPNGSVAAPPVGTFGIAIAGPGTAWVTYSGGLGWPMEKQSPSHVCKFQITNGALERTLDLEIGSVTKGVAVDSAGNAWVASGGDDTVYMISPDGSSYTGFSGGGVNGPWSVAVDGDDNVWVANFGPMGPIHSYTNAGVSKLAGINPPPGLRTGDPISPGMGYTLPSAGSEVLLHDGQPLNGSDGEPCYSPLMRMTSVTIDQAGNVWAVNNWKPDFGTDFNPNNGNPGGDGIVIFVGLAKPPAWPWDTTSGA